MMITSTNPTHPAGAPTTEVHPDRQQPGADVPGRPRWPQRADRSALPDDLDRLDEALVAVRRILQRPDYRRHIVSDLGSVELATLRLLRAVQRATSAEGRGPSIGAVAELLVIDPSTASRVVDRALDGGLLDKQACDQDRRRSRLALTAGGQALLDAATARRQELLAAVTSSWSATERMQLVGLLERLLDGFEDVLASPVDAGPVDPVGADAGEAVRA